MSSSSIMMIKGTSLSALTEALQRYMPEVVGTLAKEYKFDQAAGLELLGDLSVQKEGKSRAVKAKRVVPKILLPFCGWFKMTGAAVRYNRGLFLNALTHAREIRSSAQLAWACVCGWHSTVRPHRERGNEGWKCLKVSRLSTTGTSWLRSMWPRIGNRWGKARMDHPWRAIRGGEDSQGSSC